ncbi:oxygenase MpaB family protein [Limibacter armeniacum]|uniref:oxygenase MpaB family protein n=1 Tax=Limibacter armeniacum TaxID=466084 RepID=UPI002FE5C277
MMDIKFLSAQRKISDPIADQTVERLLQDGLLPELNKSLKHFVANNDALPERLPDYIHQYFHQTSILPEWADLQRIRQGQHFFLTYAREILLLLIVKSLPTCYACGNGAELLYRTGRLNREDQGHKVMARRLLETMQFVIDVMDIGSFRPEGKAIRSAQKVRLIHAAIRQYALKNKWNAKLYGYPINQEDMTFTLLSFSHYILEGLEQMEIPLKKEEKQNFLHTWNVIGHIMGVKEVLLPETHEKAKTLAESILKHQAKPTEAGKVLTRSCIDFMVSTDRSIGPTARIPTLFRFFLGPGISGILQIAKPDNSIIELFTPASVRLFSGFKHILKNEFFLFRQIINIDNRLYWNSLFDTVYPNMERELNIPPSLKESWKK